MYNTIADIDEEITRLEKEKDYQSNYWFTLGEIDKDFDLKPQHPEDYWYMLGYNDREHQIEIAWIEAEKQLKLIIEHF